jgi:transmembrane sensor
MPNVSELISQILLKKLREEALTPEEVATLAEWEGRSPEHAAFIAMLIDEGSLSDKIKGMLELDELAAWQRIEKALETEWNERSEPVRKKNPWYKYAAAASVLLVLGFVAYYFLFIKPPVSDNSQAAKPATDIAPGGDRAVLTLADGSVIDLGKAENGIVAKQGESKVMKTEDGKLVYEGGGNVARGDAGQNILKTPRGGEYQLDLPDGSKVWLNAASSIKYPVSFSGSERRVEITGEVYFEIAKDRNRKFLVDIKNSGGESRGEIEVLGTHFNVQAYDEEKTIVASLIEGKIKMSASQPGAGKVLSPGQQAQLTENNTLKVVDDVDLDHVIAWKNGNISFKSADIPTIMREISRWYNIDVVFEGDVENKGGINGDAVRSTTLVNLIKVLQLNNVNCSIENGKLVVRPGNATKTRAP